MDEPELEERLDELTAERDELRAQQREREQTADRIESLESDLEQREAENDRRGDELADLENEKESLEEEVAELRSTSDDEMLGLHAEASSLVHEVYKDVPFMLLDSLEAIDAPRINELIQYIDDIAPNVVVALLPEDAAALPAEYHRVGLRGRRGRSRPVDRDTRPKRFVRRYTDTSS